MLAGAAGATAQILIYPMELIKARMAVASAGEFRGLGDCVVQCWRRGGAREFYKGLGANLSGIVPNRGIEMGLFFTLEDLWRSSTGEAPPVKALTVMGCGVLDHRTNCDLPVEFSAAENANSRGERTPGYLLLHVSLHHPYFSQ